MDGASWKHELQQRRSVSLEATVGNKLHIGERADRLPEVIVLILIVAAAIVLLVSATLALVNMSLP